MASPRALRTNLETDIDRAAALVNAVRLPNFQQALIHELAFLRCFLAWEVFLEDTFYAYLLGRAAPDGSTYQRYLTPRGLDHAKEVIRGGRPFITWTDPARVVDRAELFLRHGEPYATVIGNVSSELVEMRTVRNRIAHRSDSASAKFLELVRQRLGTVPNGMSAGRFLRGTDAGATSTRFEVYLTLLRVSAAAIAPG
jgi:hypothetical protein